jgi:hypothetical protein
VAVYGWSGASTLFNDVRSTRSGRRSVPDQDRLHCLFGLAGDQGEHLVAGL